MSDDPTGAGALAVVAAEIGDLLDRTSGRLIVGVTGPPGTGKSTFARRVVERLTPDLPEPPAFLPMDGFHLSNRQLIRLGRRDRKGAPDTFDVDGYVAALRRVAAASGDVYVPDFDRVLDEAVVASLVVPAAARLVITEGNYLAWADDGWGSVRSEVHRMYYLDSPPEVRRRRLIARQLAGGRSQRDAQQWVDSVDTPNAVLIARTESRCDISLFVG